MHYGQHPLKSKNKSCQRSLSMHFNEKCLPIPLFESATSSYFLNLETKKPHRFAAMQWA
jgi:hypothetical protein